MVLLSGISSAKADDIYLFYNASSDNLSELGLSKKETSRVFEDEFGPAAEELPLEIKFDDFYVAKYPNESYSFILNAPYNCGRLGCKTMVYTRDEDGDLFSSESTTPVKCKVYDSDKLLCTQGGYHPEVKVKPKKKILHFYPPQSSDK